MPLMQPLNSTDRAVVASFFIQEATAIREVIQLLSRVRHPATAKIKRLAKTVDLYLSVASGVEAALDLIAMAETLDSIDDVSWILAVMTKYGLSTAAPLSSDVVVSEIVAALLDLLVTLNKKQS